MRILILEDNAERQMEMALILRDRFPQYPIEFFSSAPGFLQRMREGTLEDVALIGLDHDLEMIEEETDGDLTDPGSGMDIARAIAALSPGPPIVIHTTNRAAGDGMEEILRAAGWKVDRIVPYGNLDWVREIWARCVRDAIVAAVSSASPMTVDIAN